MARKEVFHPCSPSVEAGWRADGASMLLWPLIVDKWMDKILDRYSTEVAVDRKVQLRPVERDERLGGLVWYESA